MYMENSNGPKFEPCGIPHCTFCGDLELFSMQTCLRLLKYNLISLWAGEYSGRLCRMFFKIKEKDPH